MAKYIQDPDPVQLAPGLEYSLKQLVTLVVDSSPGFQKPASAARAGARILEAFDDCEDGWYELEEGDWKILHAELEKAEVMPQLTFSQRGEDGKSVVQKSIPLPTHKMIPLVDAVDQARNSKPKQIEKCTDEQ